MNFTAGAKVKLNTLIKVVSFVAGVGFALLGAAWVFIAASGAVKAGGTAGYVGSVGFLLIAAPLLAFPFNARVAKFLFVLLLFAVAFDMLWLVFQPSLTTSHPVLVQGAAIALVVTLLARVGLALRRKRPAHDN